MSDDDIQISHLKKAVEDAVKETTEARAHSERLNTVIHDLTSTRNYALEELKKIEHKLQAAEWFIDRFVDKLIERIGV
jgi:flagellar biosynthesis chaperone FliJ